MSTNNIVPIGCVTKHDINDTGFIPFSDMVPVKNVEECILQAEKYGNLCSENKKSGDNKCTYVAYQDGRVIDLLRDADSIYQKVQNCQTDAEKNKYTMQSLQKFQDIWMNYTPADRKKQLDPNSGVPFLDNYAPWIRKNDNYMTFFTSNKNASRKPIHMKNLCWVGGKNVLDTKYTELVNFDKNKNPKCKYGLYIVPGTEGENVADRLRKYHWQVATETKRKADEASKKAEISHAMAQFMSDPKTANMELYSLFAAAQKTKMKLERDAATQDVRSSIDTNLSSLQDKEKLVKMYNNLADTSRIAINSNIDFVKDKKQVAQKMDADLQTLTWSLEESENKEILQNKITTTLGIIIMLFAGLCVGLMVYYLIGGSEGVTKIKNKTNKGMLDNLFGLNKTGKANSANKKALNKIFS